ncbi:MAG TPA: hypothetical protein DCG85_08805 [Lachnospiraceae bacterium]|jgi:hypothetical protein|nr:hypothetical protein [Lachnospiraceae bacterium]
MDAGMEVLEGIVIFIVVGGFLVSIAPPIILDIIWYKRVKSGKSPKFGPLGIISIIVTVWTLLGLPYEFTLLKELAGFIR